MSVQTVYQLSFNSGWLKTNLDPSHELVLLAERIDWQTLTDKLAHFYSLRGRRAKAPRLMIALHLIKHIYNLSDEQVVKGLSENIYYRFFCGLDNDLQAWSAKRPLDSSTMTNFRKRIGAAGMRLIENVVNGQLLKEKRINPKSQIVDTTAMEKHIAFPTDGNLLHRAIGKLSKLVGRLKRRGLSVHVRSFKRLARKQILKINKFGRGSKQRREEGTKSLIGYLKQMLKGVPTILNAQKRGATEHENTRIEATKEEIKGIRDLTNRVIDQAEQRQEGIHVKNKVFSLHEPDTTVIAKGKRSKRYEFGSKVSLSQDPNGYILGHQEYHQNIADINTLEPAINDWAKTLGEYPDEIAGDRGYHTSNIPEALTKVKRIAIPTRGRKKHPDQNKRYFKRLQRYRNHIEPAIGHLKNDHRLNRSRYKGKEGDTLNVGWAVLAWNSKKWSRELRKELKSIA